ncbi:ORF437 [White spot syndrome virus]|nr:hypothetical protein [White spot syndrome virus]ATU84238.1 ORF437 [White spot syndrome virus]
MDKYCRGRRKDCLSNRFCPGGTKKGPGRMGSSDKGTRKRPRSKRRDICTRFQRSRRQNT